jgi:glycosyltransferase involved in cell wall biosynthesis
MLTALFALLALVLAGSATAEEWGERQDGERRGLHATRVAAGEGSRVSVIVASRDRPDMLRRCVASILASEHDDFELVVVDQSSVSAGLPSDPRLRHLRSATTGKSAALNVGIREARGAILAFTDDDCTAGKDWLVRAESLFAEHPELDMAFGGLVPMGHDPSRFVVPGTLFTSNSFRIVSGRSHAHVKGGAGANLIARRPLFDTIGAWDEQIGPGSQFKPCEEWDIYYRALASGAVVALVPDLEMVH